jgi:hypothetical protein
MRTGKTISANELQLVSRFEALRTVLLSEPYAEHLDKPLAYWALPTDRRLPLALLGRRLCDLLETPFGELLATPGIGRRKIASFVLLLGRAAETDPAELCPAALERPPAASADCAAGDGAAVGFDPAGVSEATWARWRASVVRHGLAAEALGRFSPSLRNMTRVIWFLPLGAYTSSTLAEIRGMKTHGEKRVRAILEVFYAAHELVAGMGQQEHLVVRIVPRLVDGVERWTCRVLQRPDVPERQEILDSFVRPLLEQIRIDATPQVAALVENRLGFGGPITSVRQAARSMGLTRARVYQLLGEINDIMRVRWPTGRHQAHELREKFQGESEAPGDGDDLQQFLAAVELFYPGGRRGAAGPLEEAFEPAEEGDELIAVS